MSCPNEYTCSLYCDGELAPAEAQALELHLTGCLACRAQLAALRVEADLLREVLHAPVHAPRPSAVLGPLLACGTALGALALAVDTATGAVAAALPRELSWFNPLDWMGGRLMFDAIVFAREQVGALLTQCLQLGVTLSLLVVLALLATSLRRRAPALVALALGCALLAPTPASAVEIRTGEDVVRIAADETIAGTLIAAGDSVTVEGVVDGDLFAAGERIEITGRVTGNVYAVGEEHEITGEILGSLVVAGEVVDISGSVGGNLYAAGSTVFLRETAKARDLVLGAGTGRVEGVVARDLLGAGESMQIRGQIGRDARTWSGSFGLAETASIGGNLEIHTTPSGLIEIAPGAKIGGEKRELRDMDGEEPSHGWAHDHLIAPLLFGVACLLTGLAFYALVPSLFGVQVGDAAALGRSMGLGALVMLGGPVLMICLAITVVGVPLAVIVLFAYLTALFVALLAVAALLGNTLWRVDPVDLGTFAKHLATGLAILLLVLHAPYVGFVLRSLTLLIGLGLLATSLYRSWQLHQLSLE